MCFDEGVGRRNCGKILVDRGDMCVGGRKRREGCCDCGRRGRGLRSLQVGDRRSAKLNGKGMG